MGGFRNLNGAATANGKWPSGSPPRRMYCGKPSMRSSQPDIEKVRFFKKCTVADTNHSLFFEVQGPSAYRGAI
jgi:hypothetical protein